MTPVKGRPRLPEAQRRPTPGKHRHRALTHRGTKAGRRQAREHKLGVTTRHKRSKAGRPKAGKAAGTTESATKQGRPSARQIAKQRTQAEKAPRPTKARTLTQDRRHPHRKHKPQSGLSLRHQRSQDDKAKPETMVCHCNEQRSLLLRLH